jgi:hypothetical protein
MPYQAILSDVDPAGVALTSFLKIQEQRAQAASAQTDAVKLVASIQAQNALAEYRTNQALAAGAKVPTQAELENQRRILAADAAKREAEAKEAALKLGAAEEEATQKSVLSDILAMPGTSGTKSLYTDATVDEGEAGDAAIDKIIDEASKVPGLLTSKPFIQFARDNERVQNRLQRKELANQATELRRTIAERTAGLRQLGLENAAVLQEERLNLEYMKLQNKISTDLYNREDARIKTAIARERLELDRKKDAGLMEAREYNQAIRALGVITEYNESAAKQDQLAMDEFNAQSRRITDEFKKGPDNPTRRKEFQDRLDALQRPVGVPRLALPNIPAIRQAGSAASPTIPDPLPMPNSSPVNDFDSTAEGVPDPFRNVKRK